VLRHGSRPSATVPARMQGLVSGSGARLVPPVVQVGRVATPEPAVQPGLALPRPGRPPRAVPIGPRHANRPRHYPPGHNIPMPRAPPRGPHHHALTHEPTNRRVCCHCGTRTRTRCIGCGGMAVCMGPCFAVLHPRINLPLHADAHAGEVVDALAGEQPPGCEV
jgi:hypothetical protein